MWQDTIEQEATQHREVDSFCVSRTDSFSLTLVSGSNPSETERRSGDITVGI